jgi:hypothetical protein
VRARKTQKTYTWGSSAGGFLIPYSAWQEAGTLQLANANSVTGLGILLHQ